MRKWLAIIPICLSVSWYTNTLAQSKEPTTKVIIQSIVQAIDDEIYDRGYQTYYADIGIPDGAEGHRLPLYIQPYIADDSGWVIYKYMPYGEVYRMFYVRKDGLVVLHGNPKNDFPPTQPDYLTVYMDDDELCRIKNQWLKAYFVVITKPSAERINAARARDLRRDSHSQ